MIEGTDFFFLDFIWYIFVKHCNTLFSIGKSTGICGCSQQFWVTTASCEIMSRRMAYFLSYGGDGCQGQYQV